MAKKRSDDVDAPDRVFAALEQAPPGLHDLVPPSGDLPPSLPGPLIELYARCDGGRMFVDSIELAPSHDVAFDNGRWRFATIDGDAIAVDHKGKIWRA